MMKASFLILVSLFLTSHLVTSKPAKALVMMSKSQKQLFLVAASDKSISFQETVRATTQSTLKRRDIESVYFYRPAEFEKALAAYQVKNYSLAATLFAQVKKDYESLDALSGNYSSRAAFYEIECARRTLNLEKMSKLLDEFLPNAIANETYIAQLEIYPFWDALRSKSWVRLQKLAEGWKSKKIPLRLKAQVNYCHAEALLAQNRTDEALLKFNSVIALSTYKETELIEKSCSAAIKLILENPNNRKEFDVIGTKKEDKKSTAYFQLIEAGTLARHWNSIEKPTFKMPAKYKPLLKVKKQTD